MKERRTAEEAFGNLEDVPTLIAMAGQALRMPPNVFRTRAKAGRDSPWSPGNHHSWSGLHVPRWCLDLALEVLALEYEQQQKNGIRIPPQAAAFLETLLYKP